MAELNRRNNPNDTATYRRRVQTTRQLDDDGVSNSEADQDYFHNLKHFNGSRCDQNIADEPTRQKTPQSNR